MKIAQSLTRQRLNALRARIVLPLVGLLAAGALGSLAYTGFFVTRSINELLHNNRQLRQAIENLTESVQVGYAKVTAQERREGRLFTRVLFVVTDENDPTRRQLEREFEIEGDVIHFDALIVKFGPEVVMEGREKALFLWRRVYGESMSPAEGFSIEAEGEAPIRYNDLTRRLSMRDRELFWTEIWALANDPDRLRGAGVQAIYGNVVYSQLRPGLIYVFKLDKTGAFYPETVPAL